MRFARTLIKVDGKVDVSAVVVAPVSERPKRDAACAVLLCLPHSIPRRKSDAVPDGFHNGCTGAPGHRVAGRCRVDGSNESRWRIVGRRWLAPVPLIVPLFHPAASEAA